MANAQIKVTANTRQAEAALGRLNKSLSGISGTAIAVGSAIAGIVTGGVLSNIVKTTARFQDLQTTLSTLEGSAKGGAEAFDFISKFATKTQFGIEELTQTYIKLRGAGITPTTELLTTFTDAAAITTDQLGSLQAITDLFSRTTAGGLGLEELNRLADRGIPVFDILQQKLGRNRLQLSDLGKTAEGANLILKALTDGINERFGGATANRINNVSTQFSNLQIAITNASNAVGKQGFALALGETAVSITNLIENNKTLVEAIGLRLTQAFIVVKGAIKLVIDNIKFLGLAFGAFFALKIGLAVGAMATAFGSVLVRGLVLAAKATKALTLAAAANPFIAAGLVIAAGVEYLTGAFSKLAESMNLGGVADETLDGLLNGMDEVGKSIGINTDSFKEFMNTIEQSEAEAAKLQERATAIVENTKELGPASEAVTTNYTEQANALGKVKTTFDEILSKATRNLEIAKIQQESDTVTQAIKTAELDLTRKLTDEEEQKLRAILSQTTAIQNQNKIRERTATIAEDIVKNSVIGALQEQTAIEGVLEKVKERYSKELQMTMDVYGQKLTLEELFQVELAQIQTANAEALSEKIKAIEERRIRDLIAMNKSGLAQRLSDSDQYVLQQMGKEERHKKIVNDRIEFEKKSEAEKAQWAIEQGANALTALGKYNKTAFQAAKAFNIANAIMNTYMGATKALATYPPPFNFIAAAAVVASGLAQVASIRSQTYSGRQLGGPVMGNKSYIVGEAGPEIFTPTTNGSITRNNDIGGGAPVNVNFTIVANDTTGFDELLTSREGIIKGIISDAMEERGTRSLV